MDRQHIDRRQGLGILEKGFALISVIFFLLFIFSLMINGWKQKPPDSEKPYQKSDNDNYTIYSEEDNLADSSQEYFSDISKDDRDDAYYRNLIEANMQRPQIEPEIIKDLLWEYLEYNKSKADILSKVDTSIYISKIYITYDEKIDDALDIARIEMESTKTLISEINDENKIKYELENLSMLSSIYHLMGIKNVPKRNDYYKKASLCIEDLLSKLKQSDAQYRVRLLDLVNIEDDMGERTNAIKLLEEWDSTHCGEDKELYFKYLLILLDDEGNEEKIEELLKVIENISGAKEDYRYEKMVKMANEYIDGGRCAN